jgi:hypothetical protein
MSVKKLKSFYIFLVTILLLVGCDSDVEEVKSDSTSFIATQIQGSADKVASTALWSHLYRTKNFNFKICLQDAGLSAPLQAQDFSVSASDYAEINRTTDYNGCFNWQDEINYTHSNNESEIERNYIIKNKIDNTQKSFKLILNPWTGKVNDARYYNSSSVNIKSLTRNNNLHLDGFSLQSINGAHFEYLLNITPKLRRVTLDGEVSENIFGKGFFNLKIDILKENDSDDSKLIKVASISKEVILKDGKIKTNLISNRLAALAQGHTTFHFIIELLPISTRDLSLYKGVLKSRDIEAATATDLREFTNTYSQFTQKTIIEAEATSLNKELSFEVESIQNISLGPLIEDSYNQSNIKTVRINFNACLIDKNQNDGMAPLANTIIKVSSIIDDKRDSLQRETKTNSSGCLDSFIVIDYDQQNSVAEWKPYKIEFTAIEGKYRNKIATRVIGVNPRSKVKVGYDLDRESAPAAISVQKPSLYLGNVGYQHNGNNTNKFLVDKYFNLTLKKKINLVLNPKLYIHSPNEVEARPTPLTYGKYLLKVGILFPKGKEAIYDGNNLNDFYVLSAAKSEISVDINGKAEVDLELPFKSSEIQYLGAQQMLYIELSPKNETSTIETTSFIGKFSPLKNKNYSLIKLEKGPELSNIKEKIHTMAMNEVKIPGTDIINYYPESTLTMYRDSLKDTIKHKNGTTDFIFKNINEFNKTLKNEISNTDLRTLSTYNSAIKNSILKKFCSTLYPKRGISNCLKSPKDYIRTKPTQHVETLRRTSKVYNENNELIGDYSKAKYVSSMPSKISRSKAFAVREGERYYDGQGARNATSFSAGLNPFYMGVFATASKSYEMYKVKDEGHMQVAFGGNSAQMTLPELSVDNLKLSFNANVNECAIIRRVDDKKLIHLCFEEPAITSITEEWFFISESADTNNTALSNGQTANDFRFRQVIRGKTNFNNLWSNIEREAILLVVKDMEKVELSNIFKKYQVQDVTGLPFESYNDNSFPGLFTPERKY